MWSQDYDELLKCLLTWFYVTTFDDKRGSAKLLMPILKKNQKKKQMNETYAFTRFEMEDEYAIGQEVIPFW